MTIPFQMHGKVATLEVDVDGYTVSVTVRPKAGTTITTEDAEVILTSAVAYFPQRARFPEPLNRR
jgi:hypothetical protein